MTKQNLLRFVFPIFCVLALVSGILNWLTISYAKTTCKLLEQLDLVQQLFHQIKFLLVELLSGQLRHPPLLRYQSQLRLMLRTELSLVLN